MLNRILKAACQRLLRIATLSGTQQLLRECLMDLADVEEIQVTEDCFDKIYLGRNNQRFSPLLEFSRLVLISSSPQLRAGEVETFALLFPMDKIFERFIGNFIRQHADEIGVSRNQVKLQGPAHSKWLVDTLHEGGRFELRPDILLLDRSEFCSGHCRHKMEDTSKRYGRREKWCRAGRHVPNFCLRNQI